MVIDVWKYLKPKKEEEEEIEKFNEIEFQKTYKEMATKMGLSLNPDDPEHFYDYRALYKETGKLEPDETGHFPSKYKLEGHPRMVVGGINTKTGKPEEKKKEIDFSKYIISKGEVKAGVGVKAEVSIKPGEAKKEEPDIFDALNESIEKNYKQYLSTTKKLEAYEAEYNYAPDNIKPSIAANFNKLVKEQGDLVKQLQGDIGKRDQIVNRYKHLEELWKMNLPVRPTEKPAPEVEEKQPLFQDKKMMELHKINFESFKLWFKELKESKDKIAFLKGEGQSPELKELRKQYKEKAPYMYEKSEQWIENVSMIAVGVGMAGQLVNAAVTSGFKVGPVKFNEKELTGVLERARASYVPETGKFKATLSDNDFAVMKQLNVFFKTSGRGTAAREMLEKIVEKTGGLSFPQQVNIFGGKLYAGVPIDEMVKSIIKVGKITAEIANQLKVMNPVDTGLVFQQLSMVAPTVASKVASQFVELIPQKITKIPKAGEEMTPEELEAFERLKATKIIPGEEVEPTKAELEAIEKLGVKHVELKPGEKITREYLDRVMGLEKPLTAKEKFEEAFRAAKFKPTEEPEKVEPEPTPEEIRKVFMDKEHLDTTVKNREYFLGKFGKLFTETKKAEDTLIKQKYNEMQSMIEYEEDEIYRLAFGKDKMRIPETTKTEWMEGLGKTKYMQIFRTDKNLQYPDEVASNLGISENKLREQIIERIRTAPKEVTLESAKQALIDEGSSVFMQVTAQMDAYRILLDEIEGGEYSFDTPKNVKRLNAKISALKSGSKKLMDEYEKKITEIQKKGVEEKFEELKKELEAKEKIGIEMGIKKGLKVAKAELKGKAIKGMPEKEIKEGNRLIKQIQMMVKDRGFTKKQFSDIKMTHGGARHLTGKTKRMTIPQLKAVLKAVEAARPRRIGAKQVVSLKTENKIQSLKDTLIEEQQMNVERYEEILKEEGIYKEPKYIDAIHFITEKQGKKLIYRLLNESNILKITEPYRRAREAHPEIKKVWDKLHKRNVLDPEKKLKDPHDLQSMRYIIHKMGRISGADFYPVYRALIDVNLECRYDLHNFIKGFDKHKEVIKNKERLKVAESWILAKSNLEGKPEVPKDITEEEIAFAKDFETALKDYQPTARTQQFLDNIEHLENMPQYNQYRKEMNKARDIFESKGLGPLEEYLKDQKWGVITSGYDPLQVISAKVRAYKSSPLVFGKGHIKFRTDIEYQEQDKDMFQRLVSYKKSMDNLSKVREKLLALYQLTDNNLSKFKDPNRMKYFIEVFARELRGYNTPKNWFDIIFVRAYAMAMKTIVMPSPVLAIGRNLVLGQNMAIGHDKGMLIDPRNKTLTEDEIEYVEKYVLQSEFMKLDWFESREKPWPGLGWLIRLVEKVALYPWSDSGNRWWCFWGKINQVKRAFENITPDSTEVKIEEAMWRSKFSDFRLDEQMMALDIFAKDGLKAMTKYVTKTYVDDIHFIYQRARRSIAEMSRVGRIWGNLMLWARAYWEKLFYHTGKVIGKNVPFKERWRGLEVLSNIIIGGLLVGAAYKKVTGRREAPYHPLNLLAYTPGGLQVGTVEAIGDVYANIVLAVKGDKRAIAALATDLPHAADMFIPFYDYALRAVEASTDTKNIDIKALRKIRMLLDKEYKLRGGAYVVNRNALERWQYFLAGAGVDVSIKEKEKKEKEKGKFYTKIKFPEKSKFTKIKFPTRP